MKKILISILILVSNITYSQDLQSQSTYKVLNKTICTYQVDDYECGDPVTLSLNTIITVRNKELEVKTIGKTTVYRVINDATMLEEEDGLSILALDENLNTLLIIILVDPINNLYGFSLIRDYEMVMYVARKIGEIE